MIRHVNPPVHSALKPIANRYRIGFILLFWLLLTDTQPQPQRLRDKPVTVNTPIRTTGIPTNTRAQTRSASQATRFQDTEFYRTIIDNNLFRPLGWRPPRPREPYSLRGTIISTTGKTVSPQAILLATAGNKTHIVTIGEKLNKDTKVTDIRPRQVTLEKDRQSRTLKLNTAFWLK